MLGVRQFLPYNVSPTQRNHLADVFNSWQTLDASQNLMNLIRISSWRFSLCTCWGTSWTRWTGRLATTLLKASPLKCGPLALLRIEVMSHIGFSLKKLRNNGSWGVHKVYKACQLIISWIRISNSLRMSPLHWVVWNYTNWMGQLGPTWPFYSIKSEPENRP